MRVPLGSFENRVVPFGPLVWSGEQRSEEAGEPSAVLQPVLKCPLSSSFTVAATPPPSVPESPGQGRTSLPASVHGDHSYRE